MILLISAALSWIALFVAVRYRCAHLLFLVAGQAGEAVKGDAAARRAAAAVSEAVVDFERAAPGGSRALLHSVLHKVARSVPHPHPARNIFSVLTWRQ